MERFSLWTPIAVRWVLGAIFLLMGLNGFLNFLPLPQPQGTAAEFMQGLAATGYFFPLQKSVETLAGFMLIAGIYVPLATVVLAPIVVHIVFFHAFLAPSGLPLALLVLVLELALAWSYRDVFRPLFRMQPRAYLIPDETLRAKQQARSQ